MIITLKYRTGDRVEWENSWGYKQKGTVISVDVERLRVHPDSGFGGNVIVLPLPQVIQDNSDGWTCGRCGHRRGQHFSTVGEHCAIIRCECKKFELPFQEVR
jgi:hypothetical protein